MNDLTPDISKSKTFSTIWIVPIVAMLLGIWMVIYTLMGEGPEFHISFKNADDLVAGKTKVKLLSVDIGQVETISLNPDASGVVVTVKLEKEHKDLLRDDTRFWVERARVGAGGISGLGTLLSGAYIKLGTGTGKPGHRNYVALEEPPLTAIGAPGIRLILESNEVASIDPGDSVLYKGYIVGRVESMLFDEKSQKIRYDVFIDAPFHKLVNSAVRFWNVSGISLSASAEGFNVSAEALDTIISGGIAFGIPPGTPTGEQVKDSTVFNIYDNYQDTLEINYQQRHLYVVQFSQSVSGLLPGAPVEYRGINIGRVERLMIKEMVLNATGESAQPIPVLIYLEPGRFELGDDLAAKEAMRQNIILGVSIGLRATLQSGNLLTGSLYVNLDFYPNEKAAELGEFNQYATIPTISGGFEKIQQSVSQLLDKLNALPLENTVNSANSALEQLDQSLASLDKILSAESTRALPAQLNAVLEGLSPGSPAYQELSSTLYQLNNTLQDFEELSESLAASATLLPSPDSQDPIPEAKRP